MVSFFLSGKESWIKKDRDYHQVSFVKQNGILRPKKLIDFFPFYWMMSFKSYKTGISVIKFLKLSCFILPLCHPGSPGSFTLLLFYDEFIKNAIVLHFRKTSKLPSRKYCLHVAEHFAKNKFFSECLGITSWTHKNEAREHLLISNIQFGLPKTSFLLSYSPRYICPHPIYKLPHLTKSIFPSEN